MKNILAPRNLHVLEQFAASNMLLGLDYDGTLAPIVDQRTRAAMRASTRRLLAPLMQIYPCVVISGRARDDVLERLGDLGVREVIGNHGLEPGIADAALGREVRAWMPVLEQHLGGCAGVEIEDKRLSVAVHYRRARDKPRARRAILEAVAALGPTRVVGGKMVLNVLPENAPHKGTALERARERLGCDTAVYIGDDETDEDVFALSQPGRLLTVRVGTTRSSRADYCIRDQLQIDRLLQLLVDLRKDAAARRAHT